MTATIGLFRNATDCESFSAGQVIFQEGQPGDVMYVVSGVKWISSFVIKSLIPSDRAAFWVRWR